MGLILKISNCVNTAFSSRSDLRGDQIAWQDGDPESWDSIVAGLNGHPLQSNLWGNSRWRIDGIEQLRWVGLIDGEIVAACRIEIRRIPLLGNIGWVPRGPALSEGVDRELVLSSLCRKLKKSRLLVAITNPWREIPEVSITKSSVHRTICIDLSVGEEALWENLDKQWRYGVRRASREGVVVERSTDDGEIDRFFVICSQISEKKEFVLPGSAELIKELVKCNRVDESIEACLFVARHQDEIGAGVVVIRIGVNLHYIWGGVNRELSKFRVGEAVQWAVIKWGLSGGCKQYDLEGIDPVANEGTYRFKKKMGGRVIAFEVPKAVGLNCRGRFLAGFIGRRFR